MYSVTIRYAIAILMLGVLASPAAAQLASRTAEEWVDRFYIIYAKP